MNVFFLASIILMFIILVYLQYLPTQIIRPHNETIVYSPTYGRIQKIKKTDTEMHIAILLYPWDIHYQVAPISGKITDFKYDHTGKFNIVFDLNKSKENEKTIFTIENSVGSFKVYQIAGKLFRRIDVHKQKNELVKSGEVLGHIYLGSRVDLIVPLVSKDKNKTFTLIAKEGQQMYGSYSLIGYYA